MEIAINRELEALARPRVTARLTWYVTLSPIVEFLLLI